MSNSTTVATAVKAAFSHRDFREANSRVYGFDFNDLSQWTRKRDGKYFFLGHECSDCAGHYVDYAALLSAVGPAVRANIFTDKIREWSYKVGEWEQISGYNPDRFRDYHEDAEPDVLQWFIVTEAGAELLKLAGEIVFYHSTFDLYVWGVTHWGTSWDMVPTMIEFPKGPTD